MKTARMPAEISLGGSKSYVHPFPARMAPEIALEKLSALSRGSTVLDPMAGSGTVVRVAAQLGHNAIGLDLDPLAILMTKVSVSHVKPSQIVDYGRAVAECARNLPLSQIDLPWQSGDPETTRFIEFWFGRDQTRALKKLAFILVSKDCKGLPSPVRDALQIALSRIIVTKKRGASLAWDVSHSRPHKVSEESDFDVIREFANSCDVLARRLEFMDRCAGSVKLRLADARHRDVVASGSVDCVVTSPPYLNAIDYMRGHKLALVWLGYGIPALREIRSKSIGAERKFYSNAAIDVSRTVKAFGDVGQLPRGLQGVVNRYAHDLVDLFSNMRRVVRPGGSIHMVVGDSLLRGVPLSNSAATVAAAQQSGLNLTGRATREIPSQSRYLPTPKSSVSKLGRRMLVEHVLSFGA
jgi:DNA modification methylase